MSKAWTVLFALTFARMTMGFQFQAIPALGLVLTGEGGLSFAALGALTGVYLVAGTVVALAGGWLGEAIGDARIALAGLALMTIGGLGGWYFNDYVLQMTFRLLAGIGAVGVNVMVTKMAADWFDGDRHLPTAMGILVSSWPGGIALATLLLPLVARDMGVDAALLTPALLCGFGWVLLLLVWRAPKRDASAAAPGARAGFKPVELFLVVLAGLIWGIYNVAFIGTIAWTAGLLEAGGTPPVTAAVLSSHIGWAALVSVALGGWLAARSPVRDVPALASFGLSAVLVGLLAIAAPWGGSVWMMWAIGLCLGPAAAAIMTLPVEAARADVRALAMGIYFAIYYGLMGLGPALFGWLRDVTGAAGAPHIAASGLLALCVLAWLVFRATQRWASETTDPDKNRRVG